MAIATALEVRNLEQFKSAMLLHLTNVKEAALRGYRERQKLTSRATISLYIFLYNEVYTVYKKKYVIFSWG